MSDSDSGNGNNSDSEEAPEHDEGYNNGQGNNSDKKIKNKRLRPDSKGIRISDIGDDVRFIEKQFLARLAALQHIFYLNDPKKENPINQGEKKEEEESITSSYTKLKHVARGFLTKVNEALTRRNDDNIEAVLRQMDHEDVIGINRWLNDLDETNKKEHKQLNASLDRHSIQPVTKKGPHLALPRSYVIEPKNKEFDPLAVPEKKACPHCHK